MKKIIIHSVRFLFLVTIAVKALAQTDLSSSAPKINTFALNPDLKGMVGNSVNLYTGDVNLPMNLINLPGRNGLDVNVTAMYSSNVQNQVGTWNLEAPTGILGLGWSMDYDRIIVDHKNTGSRHDDEFYLVSGGSSNLLVRTGTDGDGSYIYETKNYQFWKIKYVPNLLRWEITKEDGSVFIYGGKKTVLGNSQASVRNSIQWTVKWGNWIGSSVDTTAQEELPVGWNLTTIRNIWNDSTLFEYDEITERVGKKIISPDFSHYTKASYLSKITDTYGRYIVFNYSEKTENVEYQDPHTEDSEPDAYQERFETRYLDSVDVFNENNTKLLSIDFGYGFLGSGDLTKRLLTSITQKNGAGESLPNMKFNYYPSGTTAGMLNTITFPLGGTATYSYTQKTIGYSDRELTITAPSGYSEPRVWLADDYAVVTWRKTGDSLKVFAYVWDGRWVDCGQLLQTGGINKIDDKQDFEIEIQKDFFALLTEYHSKSASKYLHVFRKNVSRSNAWDYSNFTLDVVDINDNNIHFMSGKDYITVLAAESGKMFRYKWAGNSWNLTTDGPFHNDQRHHFWGAGGYNYFIYHNQNEILTTCGGLPCYQDADDVINIYYLDETGNWNVKTLNSSYGFDTDGGGDNPTYWYPGGSFVGAMLDEIDSRIYWWDENFNVTQAPAQISYVDENSKVFLTNEMITIVNSNDAAYKTSYLGRFNGSSWNVLDIGHFLSQVVSSGLDFGFSNDNYHNRNTFDPNTNSYNLYTDIGVNGIPVAGSNFCIRYSLGQVSWLFSKKNQSGNWSDTQYNLNTGVYWAATCQNGFMLEDADSPHNSYFVQLKNGQIGTSFSFDNRKILPHFSSSFPQQPFLVSAKSIVTYNSADYLNEATELRLHREINFQISEMITDFPCTSVSISDGYETTVTGYAYNENTATYDPSGTVAQYNEVTVKPDNSTAFGYTKTYFVNGLPDNTIGFNQPFPGSTIDNNYGLLKGLPYYSAVYKTGDTLISSTTTDYAVYTKTLGSKDQGVYFRQSSQTTMKDGVSSSATYNYLTDSGLLSSTVTSTYDAGGAVDNITQYNRYWYEAYDPTKTLNLLTPVVQNKTLVNSQWANSSATTWKDWGSGKWAPHKSYVMDVQGGNPDYAFSSYSGSNEPPSGWLKTSEIIERTAKGAVTMTKDIDGVVSSAIYDYQYEAPVASFGNARISQTALGSEASYINFESNSTMSGIKENDYWTLSGGNSFSSDAHTGQYSLKINGGSPTYGPIRDFLPPDLTGQGRKYIVSCWVKTQAGFASGQGWIVLHTKHNSDGDHSLYPNISGASVVKYIGDTQGQWQYVEIVVDLGKVRQDGGISSGELLRLRAYFANYDPSHYMLIDDIRVSPYESPFSGASYEKTYGSPIGSIGANGESGKSVYDQFQRPFGAIANDSLVSGFSAMYYSRVGHSDAFSNSDPNSSISVSARGRGLMDDFNDTDLNGWTVSSGSWSATSGMLVSNSGEITLNNSGPSEYAVRLKTRGTGNGGFKVGSQSFTRSWSKEEDWLIVVTGSSVWFYVNGQRITTGTATGDFKLTSSGTGTTYDDVFYLKNPSIAMTYIDGSGKTRQSQIWDIDSIIVTQPVYDKLGRAAVASKPAKVSAGFGYRSGFCSFDWNTTVMSGEVATYHSGDAGYCYTRTIFENSPLSRTIETGLPSATFNAGSGHTNRVAYGKNVNGDNFRDDLPVNQYFMQTLTDPNGVIGKVITTKDGKTVSKQSGPITGPGGISPMTLNIEFGELTYAPNNDSAIIKENVNQAAYDPSGQFIPNFTHQVSWSCTISGGRYQFSDNPPKYTNYTAYFTITGSTGGTIVSRQHTGAGSLSDNGTFTAQAGVTYTVSITGNATYSWGQAEVDYQSVGETAFYPTTSYVYDDFGRLTTIYPPNYYNSPTGSGGSSYIVTMQYDFLGRMTQKTTPDAGTTKFMYDKAGRLRFVVDANGDAQSPDNIMYYKYDVYGRKIEEGYYAYNWTSLSSTQANDPAWPSTPTTWRKKYYFDFDPSVMSSPVETRPTKGRLVKVQTNNDTDNELEVEETFTYDALGRLTLKTNRVTDFDNQTYVTTYEYDLTGNVTKLIYPFAFTSGTLDLTGTISGSYGADSIHISNATGSGSVSMQATKGILLSATFNSSGATMSFKPNALSGSGGGTIDPNATVVTYTYNHLGQLVSIGDAADPDKYAAYTYRVDGAMATEKLNNSSINRSFTYESQGWLKQISDSYFTETIDYTSGGYGGVGYFNGNISKATFMYATLNYNYTFKYDNLNQLQVADHSSNPNGDIGVGEEMRYDANGNITKMKVNSTTKTYAYYTNTNKVQNVDGSGNDYVYDQIGNITQSIPKSINALTYDPFVNRTKTVSMSSGNSMNMSYDGTERRVYRKDIVSGVTTEVLYLHDGMNAIIEKDKNGNSTEYVYGPTGIIFIKTATQTNYVLKDHLGSIRATINTAELPYAAVGYDYSAFGTILSTVSNSGYFYTGQEYDKTSGLHNFKARMYDSDLAMFYGVDVAEQFSSPYAYSGNNPVIMVDEDGNFAFIPILIGAAIGGYSGFQIGKASHAKGWEMFGYIAGGALIGGFSGHIGAEIAASGGAFSQTSSIAVSSYVNSSGMNMLSGGRTGVQISFGVASYNLGTGDFGYLGEKGNSAMENVGYGLGTFANVADINRIINSTNATLYTEKNDAISHNAIADEKGNSLMSYGPNDDKFSADNFKTDIIDSKGGTMRDIGAYKKFGLAFRKSTSDYQIYKDMPVNVTVNKYTINLVRAMGKMLPYQGATINCSNMASLSLWLNGIPNIGIHPYLLYATTKAYALGIRPDLFSYNLTKHY
ncbi:hypothetical protein K1X84_10460 [bacterium]|nr:hypothetical protein [bacterium]